MLQLSKELLDRRAWYWFGFPAIAYLCFDVFGQYAIAATFGLFYTIVLSYKVRSLVYLPMFIASVAMCDWIRVAIFSAFFSPTPFACASCIFESAQIALLLTAFGYIDKPVPMLIAECFNVHLKPLRSYYRHNYMLMWQQINWIWVGFFVLKSIVLMLFSFEMESVANALHIILGWPVFIVLAFISYSLVSKKALGLYRSSFER
ncbi:hypothetical protein [Vibrio sp. SCSIO 43136]|uniref:hypothetical protein n=1 Tax=Vibrio sp. SCSIO 43136 TaxID=2819101 RepID=UPI0020752BA6|nr:hypothetical protein [Vibrio sp. SCSIO 43136]USD68018.1 hypothetical protein J4N39_17735 [Vibrio sp. SCSIO 43136]